MSKYFVHPNPAELVQILLGDDEDVLDMFSATPLMDDPEAEAFVQSDFRTRWKLIQQLPARDVIGHVVQAFEEQPEEQRDLLATWMAKELGYSRFVRRKDRLTLGPLWDVLSKESFETLSRQSQRALWFIATTTPRKRPCLNPMAALAAIALWRHSDDDALRQNAQDLLRQRALPDEPRWLYNLVKELSLTSAAKQDSPGSPAFQLAELQLQGQFWEVTALLAGLHFVREYDDWYVGSVQPNLLRASNIAAQQYPQCQQAWLQLVADAAIGGRLSFSWLEQPLRACIRLSVASPERQQVLRAYHDLRVIDADHNDLEQLYGYWLELLSDADEQSREEALEYLLHEVDLTLVHNPTRAQHLLELMAVYRYPKRVGTFLARLTHAVQCLKELPELDAIARRLLAIYVRNYTIEQPALGFVRASYKEIDWAACLWASELDLEMYLIISDYDRAYEHLTCKFDGVTMHHADKYAAARIRYFAEKRVSKNYVNRLMRSLFKPAEWVGSLVIESNLLTRTVEKSMLLFEERLNNSDLTDDVLEDFRGSGVILESFADIAHLSMEQIDRVLKRQRQNRLLLGALAGGVSGSLAPMSWGLLSLADVPVVLSLTADICSRFCWYFGFDPREHSDLPLEILAVALGGSQPCALEPMLLRQNLHEYVVKKSVMVGAVTHGSIRHLAGRSLANVVEKQLGRSSAQRISALAKREVSRNLQRRTASSVSSKTVPLLGAALGAGLNVALVHDICEAAQAVLTDRFLERKYPEWVRQFEGEHA